MPSARTISASVFGTNGDVDSTRTLLNPIYLMFVSQDIQEIAMSKEGKKNIKKSRLSQRKKLPFTIINKRRS